MEFNADSSLIEQLPFQQQHTLPGRTFPPASKARPKSVAALPVVTDGDWVLNPCAKKLSIKIPVSPEPKLFNITLAIIYYRIDGTEDFWFWGRY